jgi:methyltransferase (TIGR00027 family)
MALLRAVESERPADTRLFEDRFAYAFLPLYLKALVWLSRFLGVHIPGKRWAAEAASGIARTRLIDDAVTKSVHECVEQVVILGSGFDSRAYRLPGISSVRVFEVDRPNTLAVKRKRLKKILTTLPSHVIFVEIDFNVQELGDVLAKSGFNLQRPSLFICEGVSEYLSERAVDGTLRFIATAAAGSLLIFTYLHRGALDNPLAFAGAEDQARNSTRIGEPWTFGLYPEKVPSYFRERGLDVVEDLGSLEFRSRYLSPLGRQVEGHEYYRIAFAQVPGEPAGERKRDTA